MSLLWDAGLIGVEDWAVAGELNRLRLGFRHQASSPWMLNPSPLQEA